MLTPAQCSELAKVSLGSLDVPFSDDMLRRLAESITENHERIFQKTEADEQVPDEVPEEAIAKKNRKASRRISKCQFCIDHEEMPYCPRTGLPHRSNILYFTGNRSLHVDVQNVHSMRLERRLMQEKKAQETPARPQKEEENVDDTAEATASSVKKFKLDASGGKSGAHATSSQTVAASKPLAAFGFTMKTKPAAPVPFRLQNLLIHDFQDNDEMRCMANFWYAIREQEDTNVPVGLDGILAQMETDATDVPITQTTLLSPKEYGYHEFISDILVHSSPTNEENFDDELVFSCWDAEGYEQIQSRPPYYGTHNLYKELWKNLFTTDSASLIPQAPYLENDYENSAEEWQSEPSDAESCSSEGESDDDPDDANEFDDVVVPDEDDSSQVDWQYTGASLDDIQQIAQEREASKKRMVQRNLMRASRGEIMRAKVIEIRSEDPTKGVCVELWDLTNLMETETPSEVSLEVQNHELPPSIDMCDIQEPQKSDQSHWKKRVYDTVDDFFVKLLETEIVDRRRIDKALFKVKVSPKLKPVNAVKLEAAPEQPDALEQKPILEGAEREAFIDFVLQNKSSGFSGEIMCHEFHKVNPEIGSVRELHRTLGRLMIRRDNIWSLKRKFRPEEPKKAPTETVANVMLKFIQEDRVKQEVGGNSNE